MTIRSFRPLFLGLVYWFAFVVPPLLAQSPTPETYSLTIISQMTEASMFTGQASNLKIYRNGSKELVELTVAPWAANPKGVRMSYLFDFQAHKAYTRDLVANACSWMNYVSARAPVNYDPLTGSDALLADLAKQTPKVLGKEVVNGISAKVEEFATPDQGKAKLWIAEKGNFIVKVEAAGLDGKSQTQLEAKQLSYTKPSDSLFAPPSNCDTHTQGEWSDTGVNAHAEVAVEARGSGSANLATKQAQGEASVQTSSKVGSQASPKPAPTGTSGPRTQAAQAQGRVTEVRSVGVRPTPDYKGPYPGKFDFVFSVTTDGPAEVKWVLVNQADIAWGSGALSFAGAGTQEVVKPIKVGMPGKLWQGWAKLEVYAPNKLESEEVHISADCHP
jgi:hypothetical protein